MSKGAVKRANSILAVLALGAILLSLAAVWLFLPQEWLQPYMAALAERLSLLLWAGLVLLSAAAVGCAILRVARLAPDEPLALGLFGLGTGLALISAVTLLLGAVGFFDKTRLLVILLIFLALGLRETGLLLRSLPGVAKARRPRRLAWFRVTLWCVLGLFVLLNLTRAFEPQWAYDALEYHLAAPAQYFSAGKIFYPAHNVYANFPQNVEMLYLLGMGLTGSPERGAIVGNLIGVALGFFAALALRGMMRRLIGREGGDAAAVIYYTWAGVTLYSGTAYVELPLIFYMTLALWGLVWSWRRKLDRPGPTGWALLAGIACGAAMGTKYTAALICFVPVLLWLIVIGLGRRAKPKALALRADGFAIVALLVFSPWMVRGVVNTGNPVYPLLYKVFGGRDWDAQKDARWNWAHSPHDITLTRMGQQALEVLTFDGGDEPGLGMASLALILFVPLALLADRRIRTLALLLAGHCLLLFLLWFYFTQHNARFLEPGVTALAALGAVGLVSALRFRQSAGLRGLFLAAVLLAPNVWVNCMLWGRSAGAAASLASPESSWAELQPAVKFLNDEKNVPPGSKILFIGEARTFYCRRNFLAATVFNTQPIEEIMAGAHTTDGVLSAMRQKGITHLYVDTGELMRLQQTYSYPYKGETHIGMLEGFDWALFGQFAREHLRVIWSMPAPGPERYDWGQWPVKPERFIAVYEVVEG